VNAAPGRPESLKIDFYNIILREYYLWYKEYWITQFIEGLLTEKYGLDNIETKKPFLEANDFVELIRYYWISDINVFFNER
jgi:hypothetical protein